MAMLSDGGVDSPFGTYDAAIEAACGDPTWPSDGGAPEASARVPLTTCTIDSDCIAPTQSGCCYGSRYSVHLESHGCDDAGRCLYAVVDDDCTIGPCRGACGAVDGLCAYPTCE